MKRIMFLVFILAVTSSVWANVILSPGQQINIGGTNVSCNGPEITAVRFVSGPVQNNVVCQRAREFMNRSTKPASVTVVATCSIQRQQHILTVDLVGLNRNIVDLTINAATVFRNDSPFAYLAVRDVILTLKSPVATMDFDDDDLRQIIMTVSKK